MDYSTRLQRLRDRRQGLYSKDGAYNFVEAAATLRKSEKFEAIQEPASVKYAVGAMQPVDDEYTQNSYAEGNRVKDRLIEGMVTANIPVAFEYQGSVPLNVHVRGNSDVDLLILHNGFVTVDPEANKQYYYTDYNGKSATDELLELRKESIKILERRYFAAKVDSSGSKSISLSGGSLKRKIDVVPSHWHDTLNWKKTNDKRHREIYILDAQEKIRTNNRPFMHIGMIDDKCCQVRGSLRKVIRLLKNLRYDATPTIKLSSYDIAAIAWRMTSQDLSVPFGQDLLLVDRAREHLRFIINNETYRIKLMVPDGSRLIYDTADKLTATVRLYDEINRLADDIFKELSPLGDFYGYHPSQVLAKAIYM